MVVSRGVWGVGARPTLTVPLEEAILSTGHFALSAITSRQPHGLHRLDLSGLMSGTLP